MQKDATRYPYSCGREVNASEAQRGRPYTRHGIVNKIYKEY